MGLPRWHGVVKNPSAYAEVRDSGSIPGSGRSLGGGHGNSLQCSPEQPGGVQPIGSRSRT